MNTELDDLSTAGEGGREKETNITEFRNNCKYQSTKYKCTIKINRPTSYLTTLYFVLFFSLFHRLFSEMPPI